MLRVITHTSIIEDLRILSLVCLYREDREETTDALNTLIRGKQLNNAQFRYMLQLAKKYEKVLREARRIR